MNEHDYELTKWRIEGDGSPIIATAIHNGHFVHSDVAQLFKISEADRLREEDPFTGTWTAIADTRVVVEVSRFEVDLNRPRERAIYRVPDDAWGLTVWRQEPPHDIIDRSLAIYDTFYRLMDALIRRSLDGYGRVVVLDLHSYNHQRKSPGVENDDPANSPEINVGTGSVDRSRWDKVVDAFIDAVKQFDFDGRHLDVRENVKFQGGNFVRWINGTFGENCCALAVDVKKFFMDEWTGEVFEQEYNGVLQALSATIPAIGSALI